MKPIFTRRGYQMSEVASALQKAIRRGDARRAGYWAIELFESGFAAYLWRRLLTVAAEDCASFVSTVIVLSEALKSRDADHLTNLVYDRKAGLSDADLEAQIDEARREPEVMPDYAYDCHTSAGKRSGKTKNQFFTEEHDALYPRHPGLFDDDVEHVRTGAIDLTRERV